MSAEIEEVDYGTSGCQLGNQDGGDTDGELFMEGLVSEGVHAHQRADAAAQGGEAH